MAKGDTKTNQYLDIAANGTRADLPTDTCCETRSQTLIREVAERIIDVEEEVEQLENNPDVVDIVATYQDLQDYDTSGLTDKDIIRVLEDSTHDGNSTYYRWNAATSQFDYVGEISGGSSYTAGNGIDITNAVISATNTGKARVLTSADYNYPTNNPTGIALWLLEEGMYYVDNNTNAYAYASPLYALKDRMFIVGKTNSYGVTIYDLNPNATTHGGRAGSVYITSPQGTSLDFIALMPPVDSLTSTTTTASLSAAQGKVLKDLIDSLAIRAAGAPTTSTVGAVGTLYEDTTNGKLYICTAIVPGTDPDPDTYTWTEVGAGGASGATLLTTADYNYPADNPVTIDPRLLPIGLYYFASDVSILNKSGVSPYSLSNANWMYITDRYTYNNTEWTDWFIGPSSRNNSNSGFLSMSCETGGSYNWFPYYRADVIEGLIFGDSGAKSNSARTKIQIGSGSSVLNYGVAVGTNAQTTVGSYGTAIGAYAKANSTGAIAIGGYSSSTNNTRASGSNSIAIGVDTRTEGQGGISIGNHNRSSSPYATAIGNSIQSVEAYGVALGDYCAAAGNAASALGFSANAGAKGSVALGAYSTAASVGEVNIGSSATSHGYNSSTYRLLTGLYDGQSAHDAATVAQGNKLMTAAPTTTDAGVLGQLWTDTTAMHTYQLGSIDETDPSNPVYNWVQRW